MLRLPPSIATARVLLAAALSALMGPGLRAQTSPEATLDKDRIMIGQQAGLTLSVTYRVDDGGAAAIGWPALGDTLTAHVEVVKDTGVDTILPDKAGDPYLFRQVRTLAITSWDSGYWAIPPFRFTVNGDTVETKALLLSVNTVQVDTAGAIKDIKEIYEVPMTWKDWLRENWPWVAGGAALAVATFFVIRYLRRRARRPRAEVPEQQVAEPLHVRTLAALEEIGRRNLWQQGLVKQYQSEVTDVLRAYIEERFQVPAMESTTDELLAALNMSSMSASQREQLANILRMADMVKFAKWTPLPVENEQLLAGAVKLVQQTTPVEPNTRTHA
jgi:hypothetical protein